MARRGQKWNLKPVKKWAARLARWTWRFAPAGIFFGLIAFMAFGVRQMLHANPYFQVDQVTVFPSGLLTESEHRFLQTAASGRGLVEIDLTKISRNLERNPKVKRAEVTRQLPRKLSVFLVPRNVLIQAQFAERGPYYLVADDQMILDRVSSPLPDLAILQDLRAKKKEPSIGSLYDQPHFNALPQVFRLLREHPVLKQEAVSKMAFDPLGNVSLYLKDGIELKLGKTVFISEPVTAALGSLLQSAGRADLLYLDLRSQDIVVKKKSQGSR